MPPTTTPTTTGTSATAPAATSPPSTPSTILPIAMGINALFSGMTGVLMLAGGWVLADLLGVHAVVLAGIGAVLVGFATSLVWLLAHPQHLRVGARLVVVADIGWLVAASVILFWFPSALATPGQIALAVVSTVVAVLAATQTVGLRRSGEGPVTGAIPVSLQVQRIIAAPVARVWAAVADAGDYDRFAAGIADTTVEGARGAGMVRVCTDDRGGQWSERCTMWEEGVRYRMTVDTDSYPLYYRMLLQDFAQTWTVEPTTKGGTRVTLTFDGAVKLGVIGWLAMRILGNRRRLAAILAAYDRELTAAPR